MSAFVGPIHFWLYNKIVLQDEMIDVLLTKASEKGTPVESLWERSIERYGAPVSGSLEDELDPGNIHGWLQERISRSEGRLAFVVTRLLNDDILKISDIQAIFRELGKHTGEKVTDQVSGPQKLFNLIFDHLIEGMPCDRVNEMTRNDEEEVRWISTTCLHQSHWDETDGNVKHYYEIRKAWIDGFLEGIGGTFVYDRNENNEHVLRKG